MKNLIESKIKNLETNMIGDILHIDFDDIGNLWSEVFEEIFGREYDEDDDDDYENFGKIQDISNELLSNKGTIKVEFDY